MAPRECPAVVEVLFAENACQGFGVDGVLHRKGRATPPWPLRAGAVPAREGGSPRKEGGSCRGPAPPRSAPEALRSPARRRPLGAEQGSPETAPPGFRLRPS